MAVASGLPALDVMDVQDFVPALAVAALTRMSVPVEDVFAHVPELELRPVLVVSTGEAGVLYPLRVELRHLDGDGGDGKEGADLLDGRDV